MSTMCKLRGDCERVLSASLLNRTYNLSTWTPQKSSGCRVSVEYHLNPGEGHHLYICC